MAAIYICRNGTINYLFTNLNDLVSKCTLNTLLLGSEIQRKYNILETFKITRMKTFILTLFINGEKLI
jgi:hypothetical protein